jgi:outer membrane protein OmpA-like peptidoglycan-associated protein
MYGGWPPKPKVLSQEERKDSMDEAEAASFQITNVNFESDSYVVPDTSRTRLTELAQYIKRNPFYTIELYGYTDNQGNKEYNQKLSEHRSQAVMNLMIAQGALQKNFRIAGFNFERPLGDNTNDQGRARNRRVEIILVDNRNR